MSSNILRHQIGTFECRIILRPHSSHPWPRHPRITFVQGGHGAGLLETHWDRIAGFIVTGDVPDPPYADGDAQKTLWSWASAASPIIFSIIVLLLLSPFLAVLHRLAYHPTRSAEATGLTVAAVLYAMGLKFASTRL